MPSHRLTLCSPSQPQKKTSSLRTNCASPHFLMTSFRSAAPFVVFLKNDMAREHGFPEKRPLPTAGYRVFYNVSATPSTHPMPLLPPPRPCPCPCVSHPSTLPLKPDMSYVSMNEADGIIHGDDARECNGRWGGLTE